MVLQECIGYDEGERKESHSDDEKNSNPTGVDDDHNIDRLKRAAVTALSAAAVKAKLLAKLEENEILKLVSLVIEKQLRKLEAKVAFFADIDSVVSRMREQTEKARQRLMLERSQIIAARLGVPTSSLRVNPASLPANRLAMGYGATGIKPPNMAWQKPPPSLVLASIVVEWPIVADGEQKYFPIQQALAYEP
ncbi:Zinc finger, ZZ type [Musa troglodytarum]|uniref:Zinc finger, ZZ type n=1 Tax=Musa troglodytarum TaxID=320322 RepID=A0A9E7KFR5_9LILI|nr:Zinc finger, ZZ type [Musa troglodytarum]